MLGERLVIVSDAHLGDTPADVEEALLAFLERVPTLGDALLLNGDLFDFWFSWRRVIPRRGFHVAAGLRQLRRRVPIVMVGGNHDRWDTGFWSVDLGITFEPMRARFRVGTREVLAVHGDGLMEEHWSAGFMHRLTRHRASAAAFRWLHPDAGIGLVDRMSRRLGYVTREPAKLDAAAARQREWAEAESARDPALGAIIMGHTHRPALAQLATGATYLNPGAWLDGGRYALLTATDAHLETADRD